MRVDEYQFIFWWNQSIWWIPQILLILECYTFTFCNLIFLSTLSNHEVMRIDVKWTALKILWFSNRESWKQFHDFWNHMDGEYTGDLWPFSIEKLTLWIHDFARLRMIRIWSDVNLFTSSRCSVFQSKLIMEANMLSMSTLSYKKSYPKPSIISHITCHMSRYGLIIRSNLVTMEWRISNSSTRSFPSKETH
jgi:hypothetical protein